MSTLQEIAGSPQALPAWQLSAGLRRFASFALAAAYAMVQMAHAVFDNFDDLRYASVVFVFIALQSLIRPRLLIFREQLIYLVFAGYVTLSLLWTPDRVLAMNTVLPTLNFVLVLTLFSSMLTYGDRRAVVAGALTGFLIGAAAYSEWTRYPFIYPEEFPYNAVASMYLFGLLMTCLWGWQRKARIIPLAVGMIVLLLIAGTTSIKTNLGVMLGTAATAIVYFRRSLHALRRSVFLLILLGGAVIAATLSSPFMVDRVTAGVLRVTSGAEVLTERDKERDASQMGLETRERWRDQGVAGWQRNPVIGYGAEAFRADFGITSHSTPVDLLYNFGIIGLGLFYSVFASLALRLVRAGRQGSVGPQPLIFAGIVCYSFISLSGTVFYNAFVAMFIATACVFIGDESGSGDELHAEPRARLDSAQS